MSCAFSFRQGIFVKVDKSEVVLIADPYLAGSQPPSKTLDSNTALDGPKAAM